MAFLIILLLIILNGYFSLAEIALISISDTELADEQSKHNPKAVQVLKLIKNPDEFLSAVQVGITLLGLLEGIYGGDMVASQLETLLLKTGISLITAHIASLIIGIGTITYLTIVFGELVPKSIALQMPLKISLAIAPSLSLFSKILYPFIKLLTLSTRFILSSLAIKNSSKSISENDIKKILSTAYKQGILEKQQLWLQENALSFKDLTARRIMKPARIVNTVSSNWTRQQVSDYIKKVTYSYFPVYENGPDHIIGLISTKKFFVDETADWQKNIISGCVIPAEMPAKDIFTRFKEKQSDFGIVSDEAHPFLGIVAMQDIMEGIFGDIPEREDYAAYFYPESDKIWIAEGFIHLQQIRQRLNLPWLRDYQDKYINLSELFTGEGHELKRDETLTLNGITFQTIAGLDNAPAKYRITLP